MNRISKKDLELKLEQLNELTKENFRLDKNHLGYKVYLNGWDSVLTTRRETAREVWHTMDVFIHGYIWKMEEDRG